MASFSSLSDIELEKQVAALTKELASLKKTMAKRGTAYYEDGRDVAWDYYSDIADRLSSQIPLLRKRAKSLEDSAREHPAAAAAVGLVVVGLLASLLFSKR